MFKDISEEEPKEPSVSDEERAVIISNVASAIRIGIESAGGIKAICGIALAEPFVDLFASKSKKDDFDFEAPIARLDEPSLKKACALGEIFLEMDETRNPYIEHEGLLECHPLYKEIKGLFGDKLLTLQYIGEDFPWRICPTQLLLSSLSADSWAELGPKKVSHTPKGTNDDLAP